MYLIKINQLKGVELVLKALRSTHCIASHDLADGIEKTLCYIQPDGHIVSVAPYVKEEKPVRKLSLMKGGKTDEEDNNPDGDGSNVA